MRMINLQPYKVFEKWYIKVDAEEFGEVFLLEKYNDFPIPVCFDTEQEALDYIKNNT